MLRFGVVIVLTWLGMSLRAFGATYYIDSRTGNDASAGTSTNQPWGSFQNLERTRFAPGDEILFARGSSYTGGFTFTCSGEAGKPITFGSYGSNEKPAPAFTNPQWSVLNGNIFRILGSWVVIDGFYFHDNTNPPPPDHQNKNVQKMGVVYFEHGADHCTVRNCEFFHTPVGIKIKASHCLATRNNLHDAPQPMGRTWGAIAIMIVSPHNEISYNRITNYGYYGGEYATDGGAIELDGVDPLFDGHDVWIHHNISIANHGFVELAGRVTEDIRVEYNVSDDVDKFVGGGEMRHLVVDHNTVIRTREPNADPYVFWTFYPDNTSVLVEHNIFVLAPGLRVFDPTDREPGHHRRGIGEQPHDHNVYFVSHRIRIDPAGISALKRDPTDRAEAALERTANLTSTTSPTTIATADPIGLPSGPGDQIADPQFIDAAHENYHLRPTTPATNAGAFPLTPTTAPAQ